MERVLGGAQVSMSSTFLRKDSHECSSLCDHRRLLQDRVVIAALVRSQLQ